MENRQKTTAKEAEQKLNDQKRISLPRISSHEPTATLKEPGALPLVYVWGSLWRHSPGSGPTPSFSAPWGTAIRVSDCHDSVYLQNGHPSSLPMPSLLMAGLSQTKYLTSRRCLAVNIRVLHWGGGQMSTYLDSQRTTHSQGLENLHRKGDTLAQQSTIPSLYVPQPGALKHYVKINGGDMRNWNFCSRLWTAFR